LLIRFQNRRLAGMLSTCRLQHCLPGAVNTITALAGAPRSGSGSGSGSGSAHDPPDVP
jgi:hypothetical protein